MRIVESFKDWLRKVLFKKEDEAIRETNVRLLQENNRANHTSSFLSQQLSVVEEELAITQANFLNVETELNGLKKVALVKMVTKGARQAPVPNKPITTMEAPIKPVKDLVMDLVPDFGTVARPELVVEETVVPPTEEEISAAREAEPNRCSTDDCENLAAMNYPELELQLASGAYDPLICPDHNRETNEKPEEKKSENRTETGRASPERKRGRKEKRGRRRVKNK